MKLISKIISIILFSTLCAIFVACSFGSGSSFSSSGSGSQSAVDGSGETGSDYSQEGDTSQRPSQGDDQGSASDGEGEISASDTGSETPPVEFVVWTENGVIFWTDVSAKVYEITVGDYAFTLTETEFIPTEITFGVHMVEVKAYLSLEPLVTVFGTLEYIVKHPPLKVELIDGVLAWDGVAGAVGYQIYLNNAFIAQITGCEYAPQEDGYYTVSVVFEDENLNSDQSVAVAVGKLKPNPPIIVITGGWLTWRAVVGAEMYYIQFNGRNKSSVLAGEGDCEYNLLQVWAAYAEEYPDGVDVTVVAYSSVGGFSEPSNVITFVI